MPSPLPNQLQAHLTTNARPNPSLFFDRGYDGFVDTFTDHSRSGKRDFLGNTSGLLRATEIKHDFTQMNKRRSAALEALGARFIDTTSSAPLVAGLGRWNATETGFTLDRNTGCPYIPGSTVKGLLLAAAQLVRDNEIGTIDDASYWTSDTIGRLFGRGSDGEHDARRGDFQVFDAYPYPTLPELELGVMTVHFDKYYRDPGPANPPADWYDPTPVHYLRVTSGTTFRFWLRCQDGEFEHLRRLLLLGLDWLGVGAKKNSGLGWFDTASKLQQTAQAAATRRVLTEVLMTFQTNTSTVSALQTGLNSEPFAGWKKSEIPNHVLKAWGKGKAVYASSITVESNGNAWKIVAVSWKDPA